VQKHIKSHGHNQETNLFMGSKMRKKPKRKDKGKKLYKNTHGTWYRVRPSYKLERKIKQRKMLRELDTQKTTL